MLQERTDPREVVRAVVQQGIEKAGLNPEDYLIVTNPRNRRLPVKISPRYLRDGFQPLTHLTNEQIATLRQHGITVLRGVRDYQIHIRGFGPGAYLDHGPIGEGMGHEKTDAA